MTFPLLQSTPSRTDESQKNIKNEIESRNEKLNIVFFFFLEQRTLAQV